jgi:Alginate export
VNDDPGFFDDAPIHTQSLWGAYASNIAFDSIRPKADLYYLDFDNKNASYDIGQGREIRHTFGGRFDQAMGNGFDFDWESASQWGAFTDHSIRAYTIQTETGYTFVNSPGHIRPFLRFDVSSGSGSSDPNGHDLGTFNSLFPRGAYITPKAPPPFALDNVIDVHPMVWFKPFAHVETSVGWDWFWRSSTSDGLYTFAGFPLIQGDLSKDRYIMQMGDMEVRWSPVAHVILAFNFMGTINGAFLNTTVKSNNITFTNIGFTYRF